MSNPNWTEMRQVNHRVEVADKSNWRETLKDKKRLAEGLNDLFKEHKDWSEVYAEVNYDERVFCKLCDSEYEPYYDKSIDKEVCANCGQGLTEYAIKKLKESENAHIM